MDNSAKKENYRRETEMIQPGEVISYLEMCHEEGVNLQRLMELMGTGVNF